MQTYQVIARKYRPQTFEAVIGQDATVTTLKNSIRQGRVASAYAFFGSAGTGKTTLARIFAKALNCSNLSEALEPCGTCPSCKEIAASSSLDVLEIDGASHRGIDDIRQINDTIAYAAPSGKYKIYIIDEVHMLTKEAFNALLKTLEEPPEKVKFFFATTEPHKVPATILSRCQKFSLNRIGHDRIVKKLKEITQELSGSVEEGVFHAIAARAQGGLRDAESLLDQLLSCHEGTITTQDAARVLGTIPDELLFALDQAAEERNLLKGFEIAHKLWQEGASPTHFINTLALHFRNILLVKLAGKDCREVIAAPEAKEKLFKTAQGWDKEKLLWIIDRLQEREREVRQSASPRIFVEATLLEVIEARHKVFAEALLKKLEIQTLQQPVERKVETQPAHLDHVKEPKPAELKIEKQPTAPKSSVHLDTVMQFAKVELEGTLQKK